MRVGRGGRDDVFQALVTVGHGIERQLVTHRTVHCRPVEFDGVRPLGLRRQRRRGQCIGGLGLRVGCAICARERGTSAASIRTRKIIPEGLAVSIRVLKFTGAPS